MTDTCGQCFHAKLIPNDLKQRTCRGGPPQLVLMPMQGPGGQVAMQLMPMFPNVGLTDEACGMFKRKLAVLNDVTNKEAV